MKLQEKIKANKKVLLILLAIILAGIFLRTYEFHDWLRFSRDQARDAAIVGNALDNIAPLPLMGPKAGGTFFLLGPAHYYLSYASGKIFGNYPDKFAYPSLIASVLAIPLLFLLLREYFDRNMSLNMTAILSSSYFFVAASRFSSNPNLIPFFLLLNLYALLKILRTEGRGRLFWSAVAGISLGIGIQTQTLFLFIMPAVTLFVFAHLLVKKNPDIWKNAAIIIALVLTFNVTQIISEFQTGGQNSKSFFWGVHEKANNNYAKSVLWTAGCQIQANAYFLSSLHDNYACKSIFKTPSKKFVKNIPFYLNLISGTLFSLIAYFFFWRAFKNENNSRRKNFLGLLILLNILSFIAFVFVAKIMFVEYFVMLLPVPFVMLGIIFKEIDKKYAHRGKIIIMVIAALLIASGIIRNCQAAQDYKRGMGNSTTSTTLEAIELIYQYLDSASGNQTKIYLAGNVQIASRFNPPLKYFLEKEGKTMTLIWKLNGDPIVPGVPLFYIETSSNEIAPGKKIGDREVIGGKRFFRQAVYILKN